MRPDGKAKLHRNALLRDFSEEHPELSLTKIAGIFNITRQRAWQLKRHIKKGDRK